MRFVLLFLLALLVTAGAASISSPTALGQDIDRRLGIEGGVAYNGLIQSRWGPAGPWQEANMTDLLLTPSVRIHYLAPVGPRFDLLPFAGYAESGGRSDAPDIYFGSERLGAGTYTTRLRYLEAGSLALYRLGPFRVGAGVKFDRLIEATRVYRVETAGAGIEQDVFRTDAPENFRTWSTSAGVRGEQAIGRSIVLHAEAWFGLSNLTVKEGTDRVRKYDLRAGIGLRI